MAQMIIFDDFDGYRAKAGPHCMACEAMLADAVDETLGAVDKTWFDQHIQSCVVCSERFANAQRGSAWLEMLKTTRPEPGMDLMARILAETSEKAPIAAYVPAPITLPAPNLYLSGNLVPFPRMVQPKAPWRTLLEPRLAMTAAMAFFSVALTLNLSGIRLNGLHASDLNPANLERSYDAAHNRAVQYYDSLRVVHVMESRLEDIKEANQDRGGRFLAPGAQTAPKTRPSEKPVPPEAQPKDDRKNGGTSRREVPGRPSSVVVAEETISNSLWSRNALLAAVWQLNFAGGRG